MTDGSVLGALADLLASRGIDLVAWGLAFARVAPVLAIVPAFGLRALSPPIRAASALLLGAVILPALRPEVVAPFPMTALLLAEVLRGTLIAVTAAIPLWTATMVGGTVDALRGSQDAVTLPTLEGRTTSLGALFGLLASSIFLGTGGPAHLVGALAANDTHFDHALGRVVADLCSGVTLAVAIAAPLLAASVILEIAFALVARAASPAQTHSLLAPVRSLALLCVTALLLDRIANFLALLATR